VKPKANPRRIPEFRAAHWQGLVNRALTESRHRFRDSYVLQLDKLDLHELFHFLGMHPGAAPVGGCFEGLADLPGGWCADCDAVRRSMLPKPQPGKRTLQIGDAVTAWQYRSWLLWKPKPASVRVHHGSDDTKPQEIRIGSRPLARIGETIEALQPDLVEALDSRGKLLRALRPELVVLQRTLEAQEPPEWKDKPKPKRARKP
jgi:hypothetical protein